MALCATLRSPTPLRAFVFLWLWAQIASARRLSQKSDAQMPNVQVRNNGTDQVSAAIAELTRTLGARRGGISEATQRELDILEKFFRCETGEMSVQCMGSVDPAIIVSATIKQIAGILDYGELPALTAARILLALAESPGRDLEIMLLEVERIMASVVDEVKNFQVGGAIDEAKTEALQLDLSALQFQIQLNNSGPIGDCEGNEAAGWKSVNSHWLLQGPRISNSLSVRVEKMLLQEVNGRSSDEGQKKAVLITDALVELHAVILVKRLELQISSLGLVERCPHLKSNVEIQVQTLMGAELGRFRGLRTQWEGERRWIVGAIEAPAEIRLSSGSCSAYGGAYAKVSAGDAGAGFQGRLFNNMSVYESKGFFATGYMWATSEGYWAVGDRSEFGTEGRVRTAERHLGRWPTSLGRHHKGYGAIVVMSQRESLLDRTWSRPSRDMYFHRTCKMRLWVPR